ncbi:MAG: protein kinase [Planctomycetes bacterium]|nr:protein kinase [Planctomycetota bacterium]
MDPSNEETQFLDPNDEPIGHGQPPMGRHDPSSAPVTQGAARELASDGRADEKLDASDSSWTNSDSSPQAKAARHYPKIEGYRILGVLGQGGMGIVYRAVQNKLNRSVALKVLPAIVGTASPASVSRFRREATAAARLHHTNIVPIYDYGESQDAYYYAMELITGQPFNVVISRLAKRDAPAASSSRLADILQQSAATDQDSLGFPAVGLMSGDSSDASETASPSGSEVSYYRQVARWVMEAADALHYAHGQGIIHRDVKPANLILSIDGRVMLTDFGLAKSAEDPSVTRTGTLLGTVRYLSPEQAMAKRIPVDHRTDIYSLGALMYELLCFEYAFPGSDEQRILAGIITRDPMRPRKIIPTVPPELETICLKSLEKSPDARYLTGHALAEDLRRYMNDLPIEAKRAGPIRRARKFVKRHKAATIAVAAILSLALSFLYNNYRIRRDRAAKIASLINHGIERYVGKQYEESAESFHEALEIDPGNHAATAYLAFSYKDIANLGEFVEQEKVKISLEYCERAISSWQEGPPPSSDERNVPRKENLLNLKAVLHKMRGEALDGNQADQHFALAKDIYLEALRQDPEAYYTRGNLAVVNVLSGELDEAERNMRQATADIASSEKTKFCFVWRDLASLQFLRGDEEAAASIASGLACEKAREHPQLANAFVVSARIKLASGTDRGKQAFRDVWSTIELPDGNKALKKRILAMTHLELGEDQEAIDAARTALIHKDMATINHLIIAIAEARKGRLVIAKSEYKHAIELWPEGLENAGEFEARASKAFLWFDTADELLRFKAQADELLAPS